MRKLLFAGAWLTACLTAVAQENVKIEFFTPSIVHVVKGTPTKTLVVTAKPDDVTVKQNGKTWQSSELTVKQDAQGAAEREKL